MLHLDHIDGNSENSRLENLRILCPNCHSQTETFSRKGGTKKHKHLSDFTAATLRANILSELRLEGGNISLAEMARRVGLNPNSSSVIHKIKQIRQDFTT